MPRGRRRRPRETEPLPLQCRARPDGAEAGVGGTGRARQGRPAAFIGPAAQRPGSQYPNTMNPMQSMKLMVWEWLVDGGGGGVPAACATRWALLAVSVASGLFAAAQEPDAAAQNNPTAAEVLSQLNDLVQATDSP